MARRVLVDSSVILDLLCEDPHWATWSNDALMACAEHARLVINPIVYAEVSAGYTTMAGVDQPLSSDLFAREDLPWEAAFLAGKAFMDYRRRGGTKRSPLPDFFIGAHASIRGMSLLTRNSTRYRTYFPALELVAPDS